MQHNYQQGFSEMSPDAHGNTPDMTLPGRKFQHTGNGKIYQITKPVFNGNTDEWGYEHFDVAAPIRVYFWRSIINFKGVRQQTGRARFLEIR